MAEEPKNTISCETDKAQSQYVLVISAANTTIYVDGHYAYFTQQDIRKQQPDSISYISVKVDFPFESPLGTYLCTQKKPDLSTVLPTGYDDMTIWMIYNKTFTISWFVSCNDLYTMVTSIRKVIHWFNSEEFIAKYEL